MSTVVKYNRFLRLQQGKKFGYDGWDKETGVYDAQKQQGWRTGNGTFVLDVDVKDGKDGVGDLRKLEEANGKLPQGPTVKTPSGGFHKFFRYDPDAQRVGSNAGKVAEGLDIRGDGGQIVWYAKAPPSEVLADVPLAPQWLLDIVPGGKNARKSDVVVFENAFESMATPQEVEKTQYLLMGSNFYSPDNRDDWVYVGMMCKSLGCPEGREIWDTWAEQSDKYDVADSDKRWKSFKPPTKSSDVTFRTILKKGQDAGFLKKFIPKSGIPELRTHPKTGAVLKKVYNLELLLRYYGYGDFEYNALTELVVIDGAVLGDYHIAAIQCAISRDHSVEFTSALTHQIASLVARENTFHPIRRKFDSLPKWDGRERLSTFFGGYIKVADVSKKYRDLLARVLFVGAIARLYQPGCKVDNVIVLEGEQGIFKSTLLRTLSMGFFTDNVPVTRGVNDKDVVNSMQGSLIVELQEVDKLIRKCPEDLKMFVSTREFRHRKAYARCETTTYPSYILVGTTNAEEYLVDVSGNRRFLPVKVLNIDLKRVEEDLNQLWAEALTWYRNDVEWWSNNGDAYIHEAQQSKIVVDPLDEQIQFELDRSNHFLQLEGHADIYRLSGEMVHPASSRLIRPDTVFSLLGVDGPVKDVDAKRFARSMRRMGFVSRIKSARFKDGDKLITVKFYTKEIT